MHRKPVRMPPEAARGVRRTVALALGLALAGCASHAPSETGVPPPAAAAVEATASGITVLVEPVADPQRQRALFAGELRRVGVLPLLVTVRQTGVTPLPVRSSDFYLEPAGGERLRAASPAIAADRMRVQESSGGAAFLGAALLGVPGALMAESANTAANQRAAEARRSDFGTRALPETELAPGAEVRGFLFFLLAADVPAFDQAALEFRPRGAIGVPGVVRVPLAGLGAVPAPR
jgi:hypothetical protein